MTIPTRWYADSRDVESANAAVRTACGAEKDQRVRQPRVFVLLTSTVPETYVILV